MGGSSKYQPTLKELLAYKRGELSAEKSEEIEKALQNNSMLSAALAGIELTDIGAAENISQNVSDKINSNLGQTSGAGVSKISVIIVSTLILLSVVASVFIGFQMTNGYSIVDSEYSRIPDYVNIDPLIESDETQKKDQEFKNEESKQPIQNEVDLIDSGNSEMNSEDAEGANTELVYPDDNENQLINDRASVTSDNDSTVVDGASNKNVTSNKTKQDTLVNISKVEGDSTALFNEAEQVSLNQKSKDGTSFVKSIELMTKTTMAEKGDIKNTGSGSPFLQSSSYKSKDKGKKDVKKLPEFEGGDDALKTYIKNEIGKVDVKDIASYRTDFYLRFVIDNDGTMLTWKILGNIAPEVKKAVKLLMEEMPQWSPSTENGKKGEVEYTYSIELNENL